MVRVTPKNNEKIGVTLRRFKKLCEREGIMRDFRRNQAYEKPSERKRREKLRAVKRLQKERSEEAQRLKEAYK